MALDQTSSLPSFSVEGRVTIVTGAGRGIGNALARGFAASGAPVVLAARSAIDLDATVREVESRGGRALAVPTDVTDEEQVSEMVRRTQAVFGRIDVLINCAGGAGADRAIPVLDMDLEVWQRVVDLNLKSTHLCCRAVGRVMADQMRGSIVNFSSGTAVRPTHGMTHYGSAKAGIDHLTRMLAVELGRYRVRVNAISPGLIDTETERRHMPPETFEKYSKAVPLGRVGQPGDILGLALFLASDASAYISGAIIPVSGGPQ
ncbi:MAG: SDR family oxidoreductase [Chloroflexi bacterium]|nr:SDR family oxidoreductase [Chloroflexota bacterium]